MDLPAEIMANILSRLAVKTIVQCRCVCKKWGFILSESYFVNLHLLRSPKGVISHESRRAINVFKLGELDDKSNYHDMINHDPLERLDLGLCWLEGSVNGLICLKKYCDYTLYICNPITREYIILPGDKCVKSSNAIGFGFVEASNQYKVIALDTKNSECNIYTLGTGVWRSLGHLPSFVGSLQQGATFVSGNLHWLAYQSNTHNEKILTFDLKKELFQLTDTAPQADVSFRNLGMIGGCLCICDKTSDSELTIWTMKESWSKEIIINATDISWVQPLNVLKDGTILLLSFDTECLYIYHPENKTLQVLQEVFQGGLGSYAKGFNAADYVPSFIRLKNFAKEKVSIY